MVIKKRIEQNEKDLLNNYFSKMIVNKSIIVIDVQLERAVMEYSKLFIKYSADMDLTNYKRIILDFSSTLFLDSSFLGAIILFYKQLKTKGIKLSLVIDAEKTTILNVLSSFKEILNIYPSLAKALIE